MSSREEDHSTTKGEVILKGVAASPGIIVGPCFLFSEPSGQPEPQELQTHKEINQQIKRFNHAVNKAHNHIKKTYQNTLDQYGKDLTEILEMQMAFLEDEIFLQEVEDFIKTEKYDAAYATFVVFRRKMDHFLKQKDEYFRDRAVDIQNLKRMIVRNILGKKESVTMENPSIIIADNLSPTDTVQLHEQKVLGFATDAGGKNSHTAIVARALRVPAVVGLKNVTSAIQTGDTVILDGTHGKMILNPKPKTIDTYQEKQRIFERIEKRLLEESGLETKTRDGKRVCLHANIEFENELSHVLAVNSDGIGLFRTEGIFLNRRVLPSEDEQAQLYRRIAEKMYPQEVVIRTLDIGGDKILPGLISTREENPYLGWRAIRFWLDHKPGFLAQLKAILRANVRGNVKILLPMVSGLDEVNEVKNLLDDAKQALKHENKRFGSKINLGIMIEIPSVVVMADILASEVDFFSIGTNDLVQYTLAVDRGNEMVANLYSHFHPAVLRMINMTLDAGQDAQIPVSMCGEMAGDPLAIPILLAMGFDCLSASHMIIPEIKKIVRELSLDECQELYNSLLKMKLTDEIRREVQGFYRYKFPDMYVDKE